MRKLVSFVGAALALLFVWVGVVIAGAYAEESQIMTEESSRPDTSAAETATVDAIDEGVARLIVGAHPSAVYKVAADRLPEGAEEGASLRIEGVLTDGLEHASLTLEPMETEQRRNRVRSKLDRLRGRSD
ncbi:DUF3006 domain-containing protein [Halorhodospira sp. 9621]|uniref:DUF3006 domain-containing protein n=1 Tax=Halorhodospira sp. 9621 TaxID=2899135 RepID=UPI001EE845A5|nr:DUF3006 domain-containing protein [Halorhodospira sp. 9621]MCG5534007.1 DUF3006 domain-containing protein [Halorhodospira sp. 9621]